jgi:hypothetical protein
VIIDELNDFIVRAKAATYVGDGRGAASSRPGSHDLVHADGAWSYRDSYFGGQDFLGQEVVWHDDEPVWAMNYYGWVVDPASITAAEAGAVIRSALSALYAQGRFLGGHDHAVDGWSYRDRSTGTVGRFEGREQISGPDGAVVYELVYAGGLIIPG